MSKNGNEEKPPLAGIDVGERNEIRSTSIQPRPPRSFQDLLRYSVEASDGFADVHPANFTALDDERKTFLENALKSMTVNVTEELLNDIKTLQNAKLISEDGVPTECEAALDHILDFVDNLDTSNDFHKIGGFSVIKPCLESIHASLRWRAAELVAELCQNNPYCQDKVLETDLMASFLRMIDEDGDNTVKVKALYAVSCLIRENEKGYKEFINKEGFSVLLRALQTDVEKLNIKTTFLLSSLCHWRPEIKDNIVNMGYVEQLITLLADNVEVNNQEHSLCLEYILSTLLDIAKDHLPAQEIARRPELNFKSILDTIVKNSEDREQFKEENDYAKSIIKLVFEKSSSSDEER